MPEIPTQTLMLGQQVLLPAGPPLQLQACLSLSLEIKFCIRPGRNHKTNSSTVVFHSSNHTAWRRKTNLINALFKNMPAHRGNSSTREEKAEEPRVPGQRGLHSQTLTQNKTRREQGCGSRELLLSEDTSSEQLPGLKDSRLLRLEHSVSEAELTLKAIKATLRKGQDVPGVPARG